MKNTGINLPKERKYDLFREMQIRAKKSGKEEFTLSSLRYNLPVHNIIPRGRNAANLREDLEELADEGLVFKGERLQPFATYRPDGPTRSIPTDRMRGNIKARLSDLLSLRRTARQNTHFECQRCGRLFRDVYWVPSIPFRLCPYCLSNSVLSLGVKTRPCVIM